MTGTRPRKEPNPFSARPFGASASARPSARPFSARPAARPAAARRTGGTAAGAFELPDEKPNVPVNSGKALEQEMARFAAYKVEQDKRKEGAGARAAIAAGSSANEDPSALV